MPGAFVSLVVATGAASFGAGSGKRARNIV
jgi:hypothetical protein